MNVFSWFKKKQPPEIFDLFEAKPPDRPLDGFATNTLREAERRYAEGFKLAKAGDDPGAILVFTGAIELVPVFYKALDTRGFCYMRQGKFEKAIPDFEMAAQLNTDRPRPYIALIKCYHETHHSEKAPALAKFCKANWPQEDVFPNWDHILSRPH